MSEEEPEREEEKKEKKKSKNGQIVLIFYFIFLMAVGFCCYPSCKYLFGEIRKLAIRKYPQYFGSGSGNKTGKDAVGQYFFSVQSMKNLAYEEQMILRNMVDILEQSSKNSTRYKPFKLGIRKIKRYLKDYDESIRPMLPKIPVDPRIHFSWPVLFTKLDNMEALQDVVIKHPLISFRLIRRTLKDLKELLKSSLPKKDWNGLKSAYESIVPAVSEEDLVGATEGILRIQDTFQISVSDIVQGNLMGFKTNSGLKAVDAYFIGKFALKEMKYNKAVEWMYEALVMVRNKGDLSADSKEIKDDLLLAIEKHNEFFGRSNGKSPITFETNVTYDIDRWEIPKRHALGENQLFKMNDGNMDTLNFDSLCRGDTLRSPNLTKNLRCWYEKGNPYLVIKPLKAELHNEKPMIVQFYEWIPNSLIKELKRVSADKIRVAETLAAVGDSKDTIVSKVRVSCNAWLDASHLQPRYLTKMSEIILEATALDTVSYGASELAQINVYGSIGGFYAYHYDTLFDPRYRQFKVLSAFNIFQQDRLATVMFYLSDVEKGGGTAFPKLGLASQAVKGSGMFWYNTMKSGKRDDLTLHGGCPVLFGEKWVLNKWIRGGSQMFIKPCSTNPDE